MQDWLKSSSMRCPSPWKDIKVSIKARSLFNIVVIPEDSAEASILCQVSKTLALTMYREEEAFKIIVGAEGALPGWGFSEAPLGFHVHHLSQLRLNLYNIPY